MSSWSRTYTFSLVPGPKCGGSDGWRVRAAPTRASKLLKVSSSWASSSPTCAVAWPTTLARSEEHTSELQSLMGSSYAVFCLNKKYNQDKKESYNDSITTRT